MEYKVSVYCFAYNHERYIRKTLEGFVRQKTDFPFQVIVHDDASTDGTADIIREYAAAYPDIIFPIIQTVNQYSQGVSIFSKYIMPKLTGEYVAVCEGDDYWCDAGKLQRQVDYLDRHPEYSACIHNSELIDASGRPLGRNLNACRRERDYSADDVILMGTGRLFQIASLVYRRELCECMPAGFSIKGIGDFPLAIWLALHGPIHYFPDVLAAYRVGVQGSWTQRVRSDGKRRMQHYRNEAVGLRRMDELSGRTHHRTFQKAALRMDVKAMIMARQFMALLLHPRYYAPLVYVTYKNVTKRF